MAKTDLESASHPYIRLRPYYDPVPASAQRRRRRLQTTAPSSGVLSLLATISAASSAVDGSPLTLHPTPPPFLCPYIACDNYEAGVELFPHPVAETSASALTAPTTTTKLGKRGAIADKFVQGPDGKWRRADRYTLYGSTVCINCNPTDAPAANDAIQPSDAAAPSPGTQSMKEYDATMPNGWKPQAKVDSSRVTLILTISLVLAFFICVFMALFIIWRRKKRRRLDEELRMRRTGGHDESEHQELVVKEARATQKIWAKASARWKANIRSSARRRRNRRLVNGAQTPSHRSSSVSLHDIAPPVTFHSTPTSSPRPSTVSAPDARNSISLDTSVTPDTRQVISVLPPIDPEPSSPPAYIHSRSSTTPNPEKLHNSREAYRIDNDPPESFSNITHDDDENHPQYTVSMGDDPMPYDDSYHAGHVATDDKTVLARRAHMASAPPIATDEAGPSTLVISAPVWHDEELEAIDDTQHHDQSGPSSLSLGHHIFPAPPSKDKMAATDFYDYPYSFEDDVDPLELEAGPSAPPFEEHNADASLLEDSNMVPSAPPLPEDPLPSAPDWDWQDDDERNTDGHDLHEDGSQQDDHFPSDSVPTTVTRNLPSYHA